MNLETKKIGNEHIENTEKLSPRLESPVEVVSEEGLVRHGEEIQKRVTAQANQLHADTLAELNQITGKSPENIGLRRHLGVDGKLEESFRKMSALVQATEEEIAAVVERKFQA